MCVREKERARQENVAVCLESRPRDTEKGRTLVWPTFPHCDLVTATSHVGMRRGLRLAAGQQSRAGPEPSPPHLTCLFSFCLCTARVFRIPLTFRSHTFVHFRGLKI